MLAAISHRARLRPWHAAVAVGTAVAIVYPFLPSGAHDPVYYSLGFLAVVAVAAHGVREERRLGWLLVATGLLTWTVGDALFTWALDERFPSIADVFYLASYPLLAAGVAILVRESRRPARAALLDTAIVTVPLVLALWVAFIQPLVSSPSDSVLFRAVSSFYPVGDGILLALLLALVLRPGPRRMSYWLLVGGVLGLLVSDLAYDRMLTVGEYVTGGWVDCGWIMMYTLFGAAALHRGLPAGEPAGPERPLGTRRLLLLGAASIAASALVLVSWTQGRVGLPVVAVAAALVPLLILARLAMLLAEHRRDTARVLNLASLVQGSDDPIIAIDTEARVTDWNPAAERVFGWTAAEAAGEPIWNLFAPGTEEQSRALLEQIRGGAQIGRFEGTRVRKDGTTLEVSVTLSPLHDGKGRIAGVSGILRDVTEQRRLEEQLRAAQRMEAVGRLAGGIAHDFNNMLTAVLGHSELIVASLDEDDERRHHAERISYAADRAAELTRQLLAFSRRQVLRETTLDLNAVVAEACAGAGFRIDPGVGLGPVVADRVELERVLANLVTNARESMPAGATVKVATRNVELDAAFVARNAGARAGSYVELSVSDTGAGMDEETLERVFEPFFTTKPEGDTAGAGLGLSTVYGIVKQSNGYVSAESVQGAGSVFRVFLPRTDAALPAEPAPEPVAIGRVASVLLVEDELIVRELVTDMLEDAGFLVQATGNPEHALTLASEGGRIDLVITDLVMPGMNGRRLAERLEQIRPGIPVLFTSGYAGAENLRSGRLAEGGAFLPKPFTVDELVHAARSLLAARHQAPAAPAVAAANATA